MQLRWRSSSAKADPGSVRRELEAAFDGTGDLVRLEAVCRRNLDLIEASFAGWWADRPALDDERAMDRHVQVLGNVAMLFNSRLGRPALLASIMGPPDENPIAQWQAALAEGSQLLETGDDDGAAHIGRKVLQGLEGLKASQNMEEERAQANYLLGTAAFQSGHVPAAREPLEAAVGLYKGMKAVPPLSHLLNLFDVYRYLGLSQSAAQLADYVAQHMQGDAGAFYRRQGSILRAGEPLLRVIARIDNLRYEIEDAPAAIRASGNASVGIEFRRNRPTIDRSVRTTQRGMALATNGEDAAALSAFDEAAGIDPFDPHPAYQIGVMMLSRDRWLEAKAAFEIADGLAPGWFFAKRYAWLADQASRGNVGASTARTVIDMDGPGDPAARLRLLDKAIADDPDLGLLHLYAGKAEAERRRSREAIAHYRRGLVGRHEDDVRSELQLALAVELRRGDEAHDLFEQAASVDGCPNTSGFARLTLLTATQ